MRKRTLHQPDLFASVLACALLALPCGMRVLAQDVVILQTRTGGRESTRRLTGVITDYRGDALVLFRNEREERLDPNRVVRIETTYTPQYVEGRKRRDSREYSAALTLLGQALEREDRNWVRRDVLALMTECRYNLGRIDEACKTFRIVYGSDPATRHLAVIPLAWRSESTPPALVQAARQWLEETGNEGAQLLGSSWLLSGPQRREAEASLRALTDARDKRIAQLAQAQLWRMQLVTADPSQVEVWQTAIDRMPETLRAGPYFLLGQLHARHGQREKAAVAFMRLPILFAHLRPLGEQSLLAAAAQLETMGRIEEARNTYRELINNYPGSILENEARERYRGLEERRKQEPGR